MLRLNGRPFMRRQLEGTADADYRPSLAVSLMFNPQQRSNGTPSIDSQRCGVGYDVELTGDRMSGNATESSAANSFVSPIHLWLRLRTLNDP